MQAQVLTDKSKLSKFELAVLIIASTVTITLVSTCSPLYPFNPWDDVNCFYTLGRGIIHGLIPYKDLYEQKGPLLYFLYAFAALISEKSLFVIWIFECISASVYSVYSWKIIKLFSNPSKFSIAIMPLFTGAVYTIKMFNFGGNAEELCFPLLTIVLFIVLKSIVNLDGLPTKTEAVLCGLISGVLFWVKYTFLGFMIGICIYILLLTIKRKSLLRLWSLVWRFLAGFIIISIPVLLYFLFNGALINLWEAYFYNNIFYYHSDSSNSIPIISNLIMIAYELYVTIKAFPVFGVMLLLSLIAMLFIGKTQRKKTYILFFLTLSISAAFIFTRAVLIYYYGYLMCYCFGFALLPIVNGWNKLENLLKQNKSFIRSLLTIFFLVIYALSIFLCKNMYLIFKPKTSLAQFRMAETINQTPDAKVLTYDVMDAGFYTAAGLLPCNRYYCFLNIEDTYPPILEEQNRLIDSGYFDYIVTSCVFDEEFTNYELVQEENIPYVDFDGKEILTGYKLYKKI